MEPAIALTVLNSGSRASTAASRSSTTWSTSARSTDSSRSTRRAARSDGGADRRQSDRHAITAAPLAVDNKVIVGILVAKPASAIPRRLRCEERQTIVAAAHCAVSGEPGSDTWPGDSCARRRRDVAHRLARSGAPGSTGHRQSGTGLERRRAQGRQPLHLLAARHDVETGKLRWHFQFTPHDVHDRDANQIRCWSMRKALLPGHDAIARRDGEPQRLLLRARPQDRRVPARRAVREADVGEGTRREGTPDPRSRHGAVGERDARVSEPAGIDELVEPVVQPEDRHALRPGARDGIGLLQVGDRVPPRHLLHRRQREAAGRGIVGRGPAIDAASGKPAWTRRRRRRGPA